MPGRAGSAEHCLARRTFDRMVMPRSRSRSLLSMMRICGCRPGQATALLQEGSAKRKAPRRGLPHRGGPLLPPARRAVHRPGLISKPQCFWAGQGWSRPAQGCLPAYLHGLVVAEHLGLLQHGIHQRGLACTHVAAVEQVTPWMVACLGRRQRRRSPPQAGTAWGAGCQHGQCTTGGGSSGG